MRKAASEGIMRHNNDMFGLQVLDLRLDILNRGVLLLLFLTGIVGMAGLPFETENIPTLLVYAAILMLSILCAFLSWTGMQRLPLWICAWGALGLSLLLVVASRGNISPSWVSVSCALAILLIGPRAGWCAATISGVSLTVLTLAQPHRMPFSEAVAASLLAIIVVFLLNVVWHVLVDTLQWMSDGCELAFRQSNELRNKRAELESAFKSLGLTSFALARANEQLEIMVRFAEDARRSKQEFAANVSHELRTPLNLIIGFSDVILNAPTTYYAERLPAKLLADIQAIHRNAEHLSSLVNDILDLSQMDVNYMTIVREPVRVDSFIQSALDDFRPLATRRGLAVDMAITPNLPEIYADRTRIRQVLLNLLNNALRFTETGNITICAGTMSQVDRMSTAGNGQIQQVEQPAGLPRDSSEIVISVSDTGSGISPADLLRIFEPFTQVDNSIRRKRGGSGLGLTISKRFVELHGGQMWVRSAPGAGSTFYFSLPVIPPAAEITVESTPLEVHRHEIGALVVVEQTPTLSRLLEHHLEGIHIAHVADITELAAMAKANTPEAVLVNEPFENLLTPSQWPSELKQVPVMHCYLAGTNERIFSALSRGTEAAGIKELSDSVLGRNFLTKPVTREQLYHALESMLNRVARPSVKPAADGQAAHILVVEDDIDTARLFSRMLRMASLELKLPYQALIPIEALNGQEALDFLRTPHEYTLDSVLLDMQLGAISGFDVLREMESDEYLRHIPVCMITGGELRDEPLLTPYLALTRQSGLTARELTKAIAAIIPVVLPGIAVLAPQPSATWRSTEQH